MNRRHLLQAMLTLPVAGAVGGCRYEHHHPSGVSSRSGTLKVILQGPFVLVLDSQNNYRIKAYVPYDADGLHEFRYLDPQSGPVSGEKSPDGRRQQYQFTLPEDHLEISGRAPHIDSGFYDFQLRAGAWQSMPDDYFVALDLPKPDLITFVPPTIPVLMAGNKLAMMPTNHVLEYSVPDYDDISKVMVHSRQLGDKPPVSCADLLGRYRGHWQKMEQSHRNDRQRAHMEATLTGCSSASVSAFFFGVGLPPNTADFERDAPAHALAFFNQKVLGSLPNSPDRAGRTLLEVDVKPCQPASGGEARLVSAVQSYEQPRLLPVSSADDCRAGGVVATR